VDTQDLRPLTTRIVERWLHGPQHAICRDHCPCVSEMKTSLRLAKWLIGLAVTAALTSLFRSGCDMAALSQQINSPPPRSGEVLPALDGKK